MDVHATIQPGVGCYYKNSDRFRVLVVVLATIQGSTELKYRATLPFLSFLHFAYLEIVGSSPVASVLVWEKNNFNS